MPRFETGLLILGCAVALWTVAGAPAQAGIECVVRDGAAPTRITDNETKAEIAVLKPGDHIFEDNDGFHVLVGDKASSGFTEFNVDGPWSEEQDSHAQQMANFAAKFDCGFETKAGGYPVVLDSAESLKAVGAELGIYPGIGRQPGGTLRCTRHLIQGDGYSSQNVDIRKSTYAVYKSMGYDPATLCMVLTSGQLRYDPETGDRIPTYVVWTEEREVWEERPFFAPSCLARGKISRPIGSVAVYTPAGCRIVYHPWSGRKLNDEEAAYFSSHPLLDVVGDAGDASEDSRNLASDTTRRYTKAKLRAVRDRREQSFGKSVSWPKP